MIQIVSAREWKYLYKNIEIYIYNYNIIVTFVNNLIQFDKCNGSDL